MLYIVYFFWVTELSYGFNSAWFGFPDPEHRILDYH